MTKPTNATHILLMFVDDISMDMPVDCRLAKMAHRVVGTQTMGLTWHT